MKKIKICLLFFSVLMLLAACGQGEEPRDPILPESGEPSEDVTPVPQPPDDTQSPPLDSVTEDDTLPPREGMVRSRLTNEWTEPEIVGSRPIAVIIPNEANAIPHYNLSKASILYEANVEGRMSRMMGIFEDWKDLEKIGNVRSLRTYFAFWAFEWDALLVHIGGPYYVNELLALPTTQHIDGNSDADSGAFFRTTDRSAPHNCYAKGSSLAGIVSKKDYPMQYRDLIDDYHFLFASKLNPNDLSQYGAEAKSATYIDMSGCYPLTRCYFEYNESDGLYYRSQHLSGCSDGPHMDAATGEQLTFKNILVQRIVYDDLGDGYLAFGCHDTEMDGWYFTNGRGIHVNWEKTSDYGATRYYDDYGNEVMLNTGKTMICITEEDDNFTFR